MSFDELVEERRLPMRPSPIETGGLLKAKVTGSLNYTWSLFEAFIRFVGAEIHISLERSTAHSAAA